MIDGLARMTQKVWAHPANRKRRIRQLGLATYFQVRGRLLGLPTAVRIGTHSTLLASLDSAASILAAYANPPDFAEWQVWKRFLRPGDLFVDVGANVGTYTLLAADLGARVIAVEPDATNVDRLRQNLARNQFEAEIWAIALSNEERLVQFSTQLDSENRILADGDGDRLVPCRVFDSLISGRNVRGMKIDVEGAELQVLQGAVQALEHGRIDLVQVEWNECARLNFRQSRDSLAEFLTDCGYELYRPNLDGELVLSDASEGSDVFAARPSIASTLGVRH